jgi:hypothetical protein
MTQLSRNWRRNIKFDLSSMEAMQDHKTWIGRNESCAICFLTYLVRCGASLVGVPKIENIHQAVYQAASRPSALDGALPHSCETTHSWAGWTVVLAGETGAALESFFGTGYAASLIYLKSDPQIGKFPDFHADNDNALEDMKQLADLETVRADVIL